MVTELKFIRKKYQEIIKGKIKNLNKFLYLPCIHK